MHIQLSTCPSTRLMGKTVSVDGQIGRVIGYCPGDQKWYISAPILGWKTENSLTIVEN